MVSESAILVAPMATPDAGRQTRLPVCDRSRELGPYGFKAMPLVVSWHREGSFGVIDVGRFAKLALPCVRDAYLSRSTNRFQKYSAAPSMVSAEPSCCRKCAMPIGSRHRL